MKNLLRVGAMVFAMLCLGACAKSTSIDRENDSCHWSDSPEVTLEPGDKIIVFVWKSPDQIVFEIGTDGRFSMPLVDDIPASGKTPSTLARDIEIALSRYIEDPIVNVLARRELERDDLDPQCAITVIGQVMNPTSLSYRRGVTVLDVIIAVGGLTDFADGNSAVLVRQEGLKNTSYRLRLDDLVRKEDITADRPLAPGDQIIIPAHPL